MLLQLSKALLPILIILLGMKMEANERHPEKAELPILVTLLGIAMDGKLLHPKKA